MFSSRTRWDLKENPIATALRARKALGLPVLDLTESNPTAVGLLAPEDILGLLSDEGGLSYAPEPLGLLAAREAVAALENSRGGAGALAQRVVLTASTSEAYALLFKLLCDPGDSVLVPRPSYPLFEFLATLESVEVKSYPLSYDSAWRVDLGALEETLDDRTRAIVVVDPNNPTGSFLGADEVEHLLRLAARRGIPLVSDEVFADYRFEGGPSRILRSEEALVFALGGLSKSCGLPQLKLGWISAFGPRQPLEEAMARLEVVADTYLSVGTPIQRAAPRILARLEELQAPILSRVTTNLDFLKSRLHSGSAVTLLQPQGGWSAVLRLPATLTEEERVLDLLGRGVLVHPGYFFDFEREAFVVLSLLPEPDRFRAGVEILLLSLSAGGVL